MFILNNNKMLEENFQTFNFNKIIESYKVFYQKKKKVTKLRASTNKNGWIRYRDGRL